MKPQRPGDQLERFFELSIDMLGIAGFDGYFKQLGRSWEQALGYTREELLAKPFLDFVHPDDRERTANEAAQIVTGSSAVQFTNRYRCRDGTYRWIEWNSTPFPEEEAVYFVARDVGERKRLEIELREAFDRRESYATELEQKNRLLATENAERQRAEALMREQQETMLAMSTPIIQAWEGVLVLPIIGTVDSARGTHVMERLLTEIVRTRAGFAILDLTGVSAVDPATVAHLLSVVRAAGLLGSRCLLSGISPAIAQTMAGIGGAEGAFMTFGLLQDALRYALSRVGVARER